MPPPRKHVAFTLAEVLITLGIIGIVSALTIPSMIHKHQRMVLRNQFKVAYSRVNDAVGRMSLDEPNIMNAYCGNSKSYYDPNRFDFAKDFSKYFNVANDFTDKDAISTVYKIGQFKQPNYKKFSKLTDSNGYNDGFFVLNNGMVIFNGYCWIGASSKGQHVEFLVDTNGTKGPNAMGYDLFYFWINPDNKVVTCPQIPNDKRYCNFLTADVTGAHNGVNCSTFALKNEYPHDSTKTYWDNLP